MTYRALAVAALLLCAAPASAETQVFELPRLQGKLLDWCYTWGEDCGQLAANRFCAMHDFAGASDFGQKPGPLGEPTMLISDGKICDADSCSTFEYIACSDPQSGSQPDPHTEPQPETSTIQRFEQPALNGIRIDWCYDWAQNCGQKAADRICSMKGFAQAAAAAIEENVGHTIILSTGQECSAGKCDGFAYVDCEMK